MEKYTKCDSICFVSIAFDVGPLMKYVYAKIDWCSTKHVRFHVFVLFLQSFCATAIQICWKHYSIWRETLFLVVVFLFSVRIFFLHYSFGIWNGRVMYMWFQGIWHITGRNITDILFALPRVIQSFTHGYSRMPNRITIRFPSTVKYRRRAYE